MTTPQATSQEPVFLYDPVEHTAHATWSDCLFTGTRPRRDPKGDLYVDIRATTPDGTLLNHKCVRIMHTWSCKEFAELCDATPNGQLKVQQYLTVFADLLSTALAQDVHPAQDPDTASPPPASQVVLIAARDVQEETMQYLWEPYIPLTMATILDGDPGTGKTGFACMLAAAISRNYPLPDQTGKPTLRAHGPGTVLMVAMEDNLGAVIIPRLKRLGADLDNITFANECTDAEGNPRPFTLGDLPLLTTYMQTVRPRMVYIDAIQAVLGGKLDINRANAVTAILGPLKKLAEEYGCALVCSRHPAKPGQQVAKVLYRGMGSQAFVGTVRSGLFVEEHPEDPTTSLLVHYKSNTGGLGITHIFSKARGHFAWCGVTRITHTMLAGTGGPGPAPVERIKACLWLEDKLKGGVSLPASAIYQDAKDARDYSEKVVRAASDYLKIVKTQIPGDFLWTLPPLTTPMQEERERTERTERTGVYGVSGETGSTGGSGVSGVSGVDSDFLDVTVTINGTESTKVGVHGASHGPSLSQTPQSTPDLDSALARNVCAPDVDVSRAREGPTSAPPVVPYKGRPCPRPGCDGLVLMGIAGHGPRLRCLCGWEEEEK